MVTSTYFYPFYPLLSLLIYSCNIAISFFNECLYCLYIYILIMTFINAFVYVYLLSCYIVYSLPNMLSF